MRNLFLKSKCRLREESGTHITIFNLVVNYITRKSPARQAIGQAYCRTKSINTPMNTRELSSQDEAGE